MVSRVSNGHSSYIKAVVHFAYRLRIMSMMPLWLFKVIKLHDWYNRRMALCQKVSTFNCKASRMELSTEKRVRAAKVEEVGTMLATRGGDKGVANSIECEEATGESGAPGSTCHWQTPEPGGPGASVHYPFVCRHCAIGFSDQTLFNLHMGLHTSFNPWRCNMCSKEFSNVYEFTAHALHY